MSFSSPLPEWEQEIKRKQAAEARRARAFQVAQIAAVIYSGYHGPTAVDAVVEARELLAEAERTEG